MLIDLNPDGAGRFEDQFIIVTKVIGICKKSIMINLKIWKKSVKYKRTTEVAEPGGPGGPWPPQKFEWVGQGMFWPPQNFDHWPPQNRQPVVKLFAKLLLSTLKCAKFSI